MRTRRKIPSVKKIRGEWGRVRGSKTCEQRTIGSKDYLAGGTVGTGGIAGIEGTGGTADCC